jgi:membrane protease YdiL (CAAX protease family)
MGYALILYFASYPRMMVPVEWRQFVWGGISSFAILGLTVILLKRERRTASDIGLQPDLGSIRRFAAGVLIGCAIYAVMILAISLIAGPIRVTPVDSPAASLILLTLATYLALSIMEELGFRGYPLRTLVPVTGRWAAQAVVALAFALSHVLYGWSWDTALLGVLPNAILFGVVALVSGGLAMPIGLHAAINVARWAAGETSSPGFWQMGIDTPDSTATSLRAALTGAAVTLLASLVIWSWSTRRGSRPDM